MAKTITVSTFDAATLTQLVSKGSKIYSLHLANLVASAQTIRVALEQGDYLVYNLSLPVGTTVAMLERGTKVMSAIHKRLHFAQKKEFRLLGFSKDPQVTVSQSAPLSLQVNSIIAEITF